MTRSNRPLNRVLLALVGLVLIAAGAYVLVRAAGIALPTVPAPTTTGLWVAVAASVVVAVLSLCWAFTRGRGRAAQLLVLPDASGTITVDTRVAADLIADAVANNPHLLSVSSTGFRMRGTSVLSLRVTARRGADLADLIDAVEVAVNSLDLVLQDRLPVLLQVGSGVRAGLAPQTRTR